MKTAVITVSDRASRGEYEDLSGPEIKAILSDYFGEDMEIMRIIIPDEAEQIIAALDDHADFDFIITTGGTGIGPRDITPEVCAGWCDREVQGIAEGIRYHSLNETPMAMLSRGYAGQKGSTIVINLPGSVKAVKSCTAFLLPVLAHAPAMITGGGH